LNSLVEDNESIMLELSMLGNPRVVRSLLALKKEKEPNALFLLKTMFDNKRIENLRVSAI
jgi:hypothetical protein